MKFAVLACLLTLASCKQESRDASGESAPPNIAGALLQSGTVTITQADLDYHLQENHVGSSDPAVRRKALQELALRASFTRAALDAGLDSDPMARAEIARILTNRLRETKLAPQLKAASAPVPEARLREIFTADSSRFQSAEKRQIAVLWLEPGANPERVANYQERLEQARAWFDQDADLKASPDQGFSVLSVDYSEHAASRFEGGVVGWLEREGRMDSWSKVVAEIAFTLENAGEISPVITRPEGIFLVRYMARQAALHRPFEAVSDELERSEQQRLRKAAESEFQDTIQQNHPVEWLEAQNPHP